MTAHHAERAEAQADFHAAMSAAMARMMSDMHREAEAGHPDLDFLAMMIPHHAAAVEMARLVLLHGRDPLVRQLAERILAGQQTEIDAMRARLTLLRQSPRYEFPELSGERGIDGAGAQSR